MSSTDNLKYKRTPKIREEIVIALGGDPGYRYEIGSPAGIRKKNILLIAEEIRPDSYDLDGETEWEEGEERQKELSDLTLAELYTMIGEWIDVEYEGCSGKDWSLNRDHLKEIHRRLHD